jgi:hypothetical protein
MYHTVPVAEVDYTVHRCRCAGDPTDSVEPPCLGELGEFVGRQHALGTVVHRVGMIQTVGRPVPGRVTCRDVLPGMGDGLADAMDEALG